MKHYGFLLAMMLALAGCGGSGSSSSPAQTTDEPTAGETPTGDYRLIAWNDLGMHCMDADYSVFAILPPYNNLHAHLIKKGSTPEKVTSGVTLTFEGVAASSGAINTTSAEKTNFWDYVAALFGSSPEPETGLAGNAMPVTAPQPMSYNETEGWFEALGIPITPVADDGTTNYYPTVKVTARDGSGNLLAETTAVLPVSDEMNCKACHASGTGQEDAMPSAGWENDEDEEKDYRWNILRLHDQKKGTALYTKAKAGTPTLCASCHPSNALPGMGSDSYPSLTRALHGKHAAMTDPTSGVSLDSAANRSACYLCHPGSDTSCLRGAMGTAVDEGGDPSMQCQSCHGSMSEVGGSSRDGWLDEPTCQQCHVGGSRLTAVQSAVDYTEMFATQENVPASGKSLYRYSKGHAGLSCSACHGSPHAIWPSSHGDDNLQSLAMQGYEGTVRECTACHTSVPLTRNGGPHGMHTVGQSWVSGHEHRVDPEAESCKACHGSDYRGSPLSAMKTAKTFSAGEFGSKSFAAGHQIGCYDCHSGPDGE